MSKRRAVVSYYKKANIRELSVNTESEREREKAKAVSQLSNVYFTYSDSCWRS